MDLQFINFTSQEAGPAADTRRLVRSHAMRYFRYRQRQNMQPGGKQSHKQHGIGSLKSSSRLGNSDDNKDEYEGLFGTAAIAAPHFELFSDSLPQRHIYGIFDHYSAAVAGGFLPMGQFVPSNPIRTKILPLVTCDAALFHTILANSGMDMIIWRQEQYFDPEHNSTVNGTIRGTTFCTKHKIEGIRSINAKLNDPVQSLSDETILAVCHLAGLEMLASATKKPSERYKDVKIHLDGLEKMLRLRGGLRAIGWDTCLAQMVVRIDHLYSTLTGTKPRFTAWDLLDVSFEFSAKNYDFFHEIPAEIIDPELENVIFQLRDASEFLEALKNPVSENDFFLFGLKRIRIEDSLFNLGASRITNPAFSLTQINECCRFACFLFVQTALTKVNCKVYRGLVTALRRNLEKIDMKELDEEAPNLLLWMLLVGGGAAPYNEDRSWFLENLAISLRSNLWSEVEVRLQGWPWRPKYCSSWRMAWRQAVNKKEACTNINKSLVQFQSSNS